MERIPIVDVILEKNEKVLLLRRNFNPGKNKFDLIGGFVAENEPIEDAAVREAKEESGFDVKLIGKLGEFDYFDREDKTMHVFIGKIIGGELTQSDEGQPLWMDVTEITSKDLAFPQVHVRILNAYLKYRKSNHVIS